MKVLITGAAGLLGSYVVRRLLARGDSVVAVDALVRFKLFGENRPHRAPDWIGDERVEFVEADFASEACLSRLAEVDAGVHAAAQTSHPRSIDTPMTDLQINGVGVLALLEAIRTRAPKVRLVHISSAKVYGENVTPSFEDALGTATRFVPRSGRQWAYEEAGFDGVSTKDGWLFSVNESCPIGSGTIMTPFGCSKAYGDLMAQQYAFLHGLDIVVLRPGCFTSSGSLAVENQNWLPMLARAAVEGTTFNCYGFGGKQVRDLLHTDDLARAVLSCLDNGRVNFDPCGSGERIGEVKHPFRGEVFNVGGGPERAVSILEAADLVHEFTGKRVEIKHAAKRPGDWPWAVFSSSRIKEALGWEAKIGLREIVSEVCMEAQDAVRTNA